MASEITKIRNLGIIAHIDAGKTTVTERMLYYSGAKHRVGMVDKGTTETDSDPEEQERGITIYSACVAFDWKDVRVNLLDTPGHVDFTAEVERCLRVLDGAAVIFSAREGVEAQSETVWRQADRYKVPRVAFINKMDREGANFEAVFEQISARLNANPVAIQVPVGEGPSRSPNPFRGVIDLIDLKLLKFDPETEGAEVVTEEISEDLLDTALLWRDSMLEALYDHSEEMAELAMEEKEVPSQLIHEALRKATLAMKIQPVMCGSALHGMGVQPLLDAVQAYLPSPLDMPPIKGSSIKKEDKVETRKPDVKEPFCGLVFKVLPAKTGDITWVRVYSGQIKANTRVLNPGKDKKDNVSQLWQIHATKKECQLDRVEAGDIVGVIGLRHSVTGDTLTDPKSPLLLESIDFPETVISMAIEPESTAEREKLESTLTMLQRQDPTVQIKDNETGQTLISGMGELHLEIIKNRLLRDFKLKVKFHKPQVSYRETIANAIDVVGECHRQISGQQLFAKVNLRVEPMNNDGSVVVLSKCSIDDIPGEHHAMLIDELKSCGQGGGTIAGFPLMKIKVILTGGAWDETSDDVAFRIAVNDAFEKALRAGGPMLLEPIMKLDISTPEDYLGEIVSDLQQRRSIIAKTENRGADVVVEAHAPLRELFGYSSAIRSLSQGRAGSSMAPLNYAPAPPEVSKEFEF